MHYVCSDIHGQKALWDRLLMQLSMKADDILYVIGDAIDRGPDSMGIMADIVEMENVELFLGNHELMMLDALYHKGRPEIWTYSCNGGERTRKQFRSLEGSRQKQIVDYMKKAWVQKYVEAGGIRYALHHSYWLPEHEGNDIRYSDVKKEWQSVFDAVWYSPYRTYEHVPPDWYNDGCVHVIGHVPVQSIFASKGFYRVPPEELKPPYIDADGHILAIDGGCAMLAYGNTGGLYCMSLETDQDGKRREFWIRP